MRDELQSLLGRSQDYQPMAWAKAWTYAAEMGVELCFRGQDVVSWVTWLEEIEGVGKGCKGLTVEIIKESALKSLAGRSTPGRDFGIDVRYQCWWLYPWSKRECRKMCKELVSIHRDYDLGCTIFESFDHWLAYLLESAPARQVSL